MAEQIQLVLGIEVTGSSKLKTLESNFKDIDKQVSKTNKSFVDLDTVIKNASIGVVVSIGAIAVAMAVLGKSSISAASDLQETQGKFDVVFSGMTTQAEEWSSTLQDSYLLTEQASKSYLASIQSLLVPTGMSREAAGEMSNSLVQLAADLGSIENKETDVVLRDITSALQGSSETMDKYGVNVRAIKVEQEILNKGWVESKKDITDVHKAQAIYNIIMAKTTDAHGDIARTLGSFANQQKLATKNIEETKVAIGDELLPVATKMISKFNEWFESNEDIINSSIVEYVGRLATVFDENSESIIEVIKFMAELTAITVEWSVKSLNNLGKVIEGYKRLGFLVKYGSEWQKKYNESKLTGLQKEQVELERLRKTLYQLELERARGDYSTVEGINEAKVQYYNQMKVVDELIMTDGEKTKAIITNNKKVDDSNKKTADNSKTYHNKSQKDIVDVVNDASTEICKSHKVKLSCAEKAYQAELKAAQNAIKAKKKAIKDALKAAEEAADRQLNASSQMYSDMTGFSERHYNTEGKLIDKQAEDYKKLGVDVNAVDIWVTQKHKELNDEKILSNGTFIDGVKIGYEELTTAEIEWGRKGLEVFNTFADSATSSLSNALFDVIKGDFSDLGELWSSLWGDMLDTMIRILAEMAAKWAVAKVVDFVGSYFHDGTFEIKSDEVPAILQKGEMVIPATQAQQIRDNIGNSGESEQGAFDQMAEESKTLDIDMSTFGEHLADESIEDGLKGVAAIGAGIGTEDVLGAITSPVNISSNIMNAAGLAITDGLNVTGAGSPDVDTPVGSVNPGRVGFSIGAIAAAALGLAGPAGAIAGVAGAIGLEALADYADIRSFEDMRDEFEDAYGHFGGREKFKEMYDAIKLDPNLPDFGADLGYNPRQQEGGYDKSNPDGVGYEGETDDGLGYSGYESDSDYDTDDSDFGFMKGGIATGSRLGYSATLHGTEAVVPLPDGRSIPVTMPNQAQTIYIESPIYLDGKVIDTITRKMRVVADEHIVSRSQVPATERVVY